MNTLVSVIVPAFNVGGYLSRCLNSLLAQTHRPLEIIVVDDGSSDDTSVVMRRFEEEHPEVHTVSQRHRGLGPARNAGLSIARGEFISMVDADDWVEPEFIGDLLRNAQEAGADVAVCGFSFDFWGLRIPFPFLPKVRNLTGPQAAELSLHMTRFPSFAWNKLYRATLFHPDDPPFPNVFYEDLATTPRLLLRASAVVLTRPASYHYCLRSDSITGNFGARNVFSFAAAIDILRREIYRLGLWEAWRPSYRRLLRQARSMMAVQVLLQRNHIPIGHRIPLLARYFASLRGLSNAPEDGARFRTVRFRRSAVRSSLPRRVVSATLTVDRPVH
ncbi:MAG TPA: glycosyltransferase [Propionicimonas sp.]|jgi:glycosyltransferase involved in cell wall biosynthesis